MRPASPYDDDAKGALHSGLTEAMRLVREARRGKPDERDIPPPSVLPMTPAARAARYYDKQNRREP